MELHKAKAVKRCRVPTTKEGSDDETIRLMHDESSVRGVPVGSASQRPGQVHFGLWGRDLNARPACSPREGLLCGGRPDRARDAGGYSHSRRAGEIPLDMGED